MITWNEIITMAATPEQRLNELFGVWQDILGTYRDPQMMYFDTESFLAIVEPNYNRFLYPVNFLLVYVWQTRIIDNQWESAEICAFRSCGAFGFGV